MGKRIKTILYKLKYTKSIRNTIMIVTILFALVPVVLLMLVQLKSVEGKMVDIKLKRLQAQCNIIKNHLVTEGFFDDNSVSGVNAEMVQLSAMYDGRVIVVDKNFRILKDTYQMDEGKMCISSNVLKCFGGEIISLYNRKSDYIEVAMPVVSGEDTLGVMLVTFSTEDVMDAVTYVHYITIIFASIIFIILVTISAYVSKLLIKPIREIERSIENVSEGNLDQKISVKGYKETDSICEAYNKMMEHVKKIDDSRQEFVSNVSHELKTPMTSIKVLADSLLMQEDVPAELYKEFMTDIVAEIDRENDIISDLLTLVKMDKKNTELNIDEVNINEMVERILKRLRPIAAKRNIELVLESFRPVVAQIDEVKLTSAVSNLVENAIKYNVLDGWVHVSINADHKYFYIKVEDSGIGIPKESQDLIFDRFYRVDKTRSRETGGTGLGLAIARNIILMHRGAIKVYSKENEGTTFTMRIPLNYIKVVKITREDLGRKKKYQKPDSDKIQ